MAGVILRVASQDRDFVAFYEHLAQALAGTATVYTPYAVIAPNERAAVPPPRQVLVDLPSLDHFEVVYRVTRAYLEGRRDRRLTLGHGDRSVELRFQGLPEKKALSGVLFFDD